MEKYEFPYYCPHCHVKLENDGIRLFCPNKDCYGIKFYKFLDAVELLKIDFLGEKTIEKIYNGGLDDAVQLFDLDIFNREFLIENCGFTDGKMVDKILETVGKIKSIELKTIIQMQGIDNLGNKLSEQIAKMYCEQEYSTFGLEKKFFEMFTIDTNYYKQLKLDIAFLKACGIKIIYPQLQVKTMNNSVKNYECTGSPSPTFKTKEKFDEWISSKGFQHTSLNKECNYLFTDSYDSTSSKMAKARKLGVEIVSYADIQERYEEE